MAEPKPSKRKRRGRGEGAVFQRARTLKDGRVVKYWTASVRLPDGTRREFQAKRQADVLKRLAEWQGQLTKGEPLDSNATVSELLDRWLEHWVEPKARARTLRGYKNHVERHIKPELGRVPIAKLKSEQVQAFINKKSNDGLAPQTVRNIRATLREALNVAIGWQLISRNPVQFTAPPRLPKANRPRLTPEQAKALLDVCQTHRLGALYTVALVLGVRLSQLLGLRWSDVDMDACRVHLEVALERIDGKYVLSEPKNEASAHTLPMPEQLVDVLKEHRKRQIAERLKAGEGWRDTFGLVFTTESGSPLHHSTPLQILQEQLLPVAGLPHMRFHDLRGSCATLLAVLGVHPRVAMEILGHTDVRTTMMYYTAALSDSQLEAMMKMTAMLLGAEK